MRYLTLIFCALLVLFSFHQAQGKICDVPGDSSSIQACVNGAVDGDTILVAKGHYYERINFLGKAILVASNFIYDSLQTTVDSTIIDGDSLGAADTGSVVLFVSGEDSNSVLTGFTIQNGIGTKDGVSNRYGGGIYCYSCFATVTNNRITNNSAYAGGGIYCGNGASPVISNNIITDNSNTSPPLSGGGIRCSQSSPVIDSNLITNNAGGGIGCFSSSSPTIKYNTITDNQDYGGISCEISSSPTITNNTLRGNSSQSASYGGAISCIFSSPVISNNTITENSSNYDGGGIYCTDTDPVPLTLTNNTIANNSATRYGGGIYCQAYSSPTLVNNTISKNSASLGGGIYCDPNNCHPKVRNTIIGFSTQGEAVYCEGSSSVTLTCCDVYGNAGGDWVGCIADQDTITGNLSCHPGFCDPDADNFYLAENSCCAGAGCDSLGNPDTTVDIGAFGVGCSTITWYVDPTGNDQTGYGSEDDPFRTIQKGIDVASDGDTVLVAEGQYYESINFLGKAIVVASYFVRDTLQTIIDNTIIDGNNLSEEDDTASIVVFVSGEDSNSVITGFTIQNGIGIKDAAGNRYGGGIYCDSCSATITNNKIRNNSARAGGGIYCDSCSATIRDNTIKLNNSTYWGAGIYCAGSTSPLIRGNTIDSNQITTTGCDSCAGGGIACVSLSSPTIDSNIIAYNSAGAGGGIYCDSCSATIRDNTIKLNNSTCWGAGIYCEWFTSPLIKGNIIDSNQIDTTGCPTRASGGIAIRRRASPTIDSNFITWNTGGGIYCGAGIAGIGDQASPTTHSNTVTDYKGSGIYGYERPTVTIIRNTITDNLKFGGIRCVTWRDSIFIDSNTIHRNKADIDGGGIYLSFSAPENAGDVVITNNSIEDNEAYNDGGGIWGTDTGTRTTLINNIITHNSADACGGGIYCQDWCSLTVINNTITHNSADTGGGICCEHNAFPTITNSTISACSASLGGGIYCNPINCHPELRNTIIAFSTQGGAVHCPLYFPPENTSTCTLTCCDVYGNVGGDWVGYIKDQSDTNGNISCNPKFCDPKSGNYYLAENSCCLAAGCDSAGGSVDTLNIGAFGAGCDSITRYYVSTTGDDDTCDGRSETCAFRTIQKGINMAYDGDTVLVAEGQYYETIDFLGKAILVASNFIFDSLQSTIDNTIIDADTNILDISDTGSVVSFVNGEDSTSIIKGFTIQNGIGTRLPYARSGGGIFCDQSSPTVTYCIITLNAADHFGAGMYCDSSSPTLIECTFSENSASDGGGVCCVNSSLTFTYCTFSENSANSGAGMTCYNSSPTLTHCTFSQNSAVSPSWNFGGGIKCQSSSPVLISCTFSGNLADGGGGMFCGEFSSATLTNCTFSENSTHHAGGISCDNSSLALTNCIFSANSASGLGGGIGCSECSAMISNSAFLGNSAEWYGGGMYCDSSYPVVNHCTFSENSADSGGGIGCVWDSSPTLENTIIAFSTEGEAVYCDGSSSATLTCCDVYANAGGDWVGCIENQFGNNGNISCHPKFCDPDADSFYLAENSCCAGAGCDSLGNPDTSVNIGAFGVGCGPTRIWYVDTTGNDTSGYGSENDPFRTIQKGIDVAYDGDTVLVAEGRYYERIDFLGKKILVTSEFMIDDSTQHIQNTIIDGDTSQLGASDTGSVVVFCNQENNSSIIQGFSIQNGMGTGPVNSRSGGGIYCSGASPKIVRCVISGNRVDSDGGGIYWSNLSSPRIISCTISGNMANRGGGLFGPGGADRPRNSIIWGNCAESDTGDEWYQGMSCLINCCNNWDSTGHYRIPRYPRDCTQICLSGGNVYEDPVFCDPETCETAPTTAGDYTICERSPCAPDNSPSECGLIGALGVSCWFSGDCNGDGVVTSADVAYLMNYLYGGGPPPDPWQEGDVNCDGIINSADVAYLNNYLFGGGPPPCCYYLE